MPIGIAAASAAATIGGGLLSASTQKKAAGKAADTSLAVADKNNALYREIYGENKELLTPYSNNGLVASNALNDLLLGTNSYNPTAWTPGTPGGSGVPQINPGYSGGGALVAPNGSVFGGGEQPGIRPGGHLIDRLFHRDGAIQVNPTGTAPAPVPVTPGGTSGGALDAFARFRQGNNYQWRLGEGQRALESQWAANGAFDSGAERKAALEYGQNFASNELSNYMNLLAGQQAMGLSAAGAVAGVGTTYAGNVAAQNTNAGNAAANAYLAKGQANAGMWGGIAQGVGQLGGALYQYGGGF